MKDSFSFILILILQRCAFRKVQYELLKSANLQISVAIILFQPTTEDNKIKKLMHTPLFLFFLQFCPHASSWKAHIYALCNYLVKQPQMKTYLIFYFLFHTEPTGLWQLESDCTKAPNPNQKCLTNIHSMNNKRYEALLDGSYFCRPSMENADFKLMYKTPNWSWFLKPVFHLNLETQMWAGNIEKQKPV